MNVTTVSELLLKLHLMHLSLPLYLLNIVFTSNSCHLLEIQLELERGYINFHLSCQCGANVDQCNCGSYYCWSILGKVQDNYLEFNDEHCWAFIDNFGCNAAIQITSNVRINYIGIHKIEEWVYERNL